MIVYIWHSVIWSGIVAGNAVGRHVFHAISPEHSNYRSFASQHTHAKQFTSQLGFFLEKKNEEKRKRVNRIVVGQRTERDQCSA